MEASLGRWRLRRDFWGLARGRKWSRPEEGLERRAEKKEEANRDIKQHGVLWGLQLVPRCCREKCKV